MFEVVIGCSESLEKTTREAANYLNLDPDQISCGFSPFGGGELEVRIDGKLNHQYAIHTRRSIPDDINPCGRTYMFTILSDTGANKL
jgi:hypothetical protein